MAFTDQEYSTMLAEAVAGKPETSVPGEPAKAYYAHLKAEVEEMMAKGYMPLPGPE